MIRKAARSGFTLIEMTVVILVIALFAALVAPNVLTQKSAVARRAAFGKVLDLMRTARQRAIHEDTTYAVAWDSGKSEVRMVRQPLQDLASTSGSVPSPDQRPLTNIQSVSDYEQVDFYDLPTGIQPTVFRSGQSNSDGGSWLLRFYPDGTSDSGGLQLDDSGMPNSIAVDQYGIATYTKDQPLPDLSELSWPAGTYVSETTNTSTSTGAPATTTAPTGPTAPKTTTTTGR
jgi:prepilin-type N-terminal cleavage/methylation domain-containing protein